MLGEVGKRPGRETQGRFFHVSLVRTGTRGQGDTRMTMTFDPGPEAPEGPFVPGAAMAQDMDVIEIADGLFRSFAGDLHQLRLRIQAGETQDLKESGKLVRDLRAAAQLVLEERSKVDKLRKDAAGTVGTGVLDLAAARDEIGRRLACLRRAEGG